MSIKFPERSAAEFHPSTPAEKKAIEGLTFRAGEIDHTIRMLKDFTGSSFSTGSSSFISKVFNKIGLGAEARVIRSLQQERKQVGKMLDKLGYMPPISTKGQPSLPDTPEEISLQLRAKETERTTLQTEIDSVNTQMDALNKQYHNALVFQAISEAGLGKLGPENPQKIIEKMDKLNAQVQGLEHAFRKVDVEIRALEDQSITLIENPDEQFKQAVEQSTKRITSKLTSIQAQIATKADQVERASFLASFPLKKELSILQAQETAAKTDLSRAHTIAEKLLAEDMQKHATETLKTPVDEGRKTLLTEMKTGPNQLTADIGRLGKIQIGQQPHEKHELAEKNTLQLYDFISTGIRELVATKKPELKISTDTMHELLFASVQNFLAPITAVAFLDEKIHPMDGWGAVKETTSRNASFSLIEPNTLVITSTVNQVMRNVGEDPKLQGQEKMLSMQAQCFYDLETHEVNFGYNYTLDGVTTACELTKTPFDHLSKKQ